MEQKHCTSKYHKGLTLLPLTEFTHHPTTSDGLQTTCRGCTREAQRAWRQRNPEDKKKESREYYIKNRSRIQAKKLQDPVSHILRSVRARAKKFQINFNLTEQDIDIPKRCPVLNIPLFFTKGKKTNNTPSIDRMDSTKGYITGNTRIISWRANRLKSDATLDEMRSLFEYMNNGKNSG